MQSDFIIEAMALELCNIYREYQNHERLSDIGCLSEEAKEMYKKRAVRIIGFYENIKIAA